MPQYSPASLKHLYEAHDALQTVFMEVIKHVDCAIIEGYRSKEEQDKAFHAGKSKLKFPDSKHNKKPSMALDVIPLPIDWKDTKRFYLFIGFVKGVASQMGIEIRSGGDWDGDFDLKDQTFFDLPHFELVLNEKDK